MSSTTEQEEPSLTMMDILEEQEALQEDADAVLGAGDDEHCTYEKGYMPRQAVYSCLTCSPVGGAGGRAGVCLGCSLHCHNTHNLVELYTKRDFRCDCGNSKFVMVSCKLMAQKDGINASNKYSQNFDGLYCSCHRPYPDPEQAEEEQDEMIQCCTCEDWYHSKHLGASAVPMCDQFSEMICPGCIARLPFLLNYTSLAVTAISQGDTDAAIDVDTVTTTTQPSVSSNGEQRTPNGTEQQTNKTNTVDSKTGCSAGQLRGLAPQGGALFFPDSWRDSLCCCNACKSEYARLEVSFLASSADTITHYEHQSRQRAAAGTGSSSRERSVERELHALDSVDRVTRTEMVAEYNTLSTELRDYLRKFAESGKVVRDDDIKEFFTGLQARKKQRGMDGVPPSSCKW